VTVRTYDQLAGALAEAKKQPRTAVVVVETDYNDRVGGYHSWWDVPIAEVSESQAVREARAAYVEAVKKERYFWPAPQTQPEEQPAVASSAGSLKA
jgi:3D-(3,5/4)-trihydroxycyclohexane-1,2-dione acylhydrolase (decyclizing)